MKDLEHLLIPQTGVEVEDAQGRHSLPDQIRSALYMHKGRAGLLASRQYSTNCHLHKGRAGR